MGLLAALGGLLRPAPPPDPALRQALARIGTLVDPFLKTAAGFEDKLATPVRHALGYCERLVAGLPGPTDVGRHAFGADPLVHALFATADDVRRTLGNSQAVRGYLDNPACFESDHFYALLAARRLEKHRLGLARQGEVIRTEVPQTVLYFSGQTLVEPHCSLEATLAQLQAAAFDSLLKSFHSHVEALRHERSGLGAERAPASPLLADAAGSDDGECTAGTRHIGALDAHLRQLASALLPEQLEEALAAYLLAPEMSLQIDSVTLRVDRLGVLAGSSVEPSPDFDTLSFPELCARDRRRHLVMLVRIEREEAREAVDSSREQQRRFMIL